MDNKSSGEYFKAIAEVKSISIAAENLGISQPALSAYLKKKEKELDAKLFDRSKQPIELTEVGQAYLDYLNKLQGLQSELNQNIADIEGLKKGKLRVGGASFFNVAYIPRAVAEFAKLYQGVEIEIVDGTVPELTTAAHNGILDLFITPIADEDDRFEYEKLLDEKIYIAVPKEWDINKKIKGQKLTKSEFEELCENTFVVLKNSQHIGKKMEAIFNYYGCRPAHTITAEQTMTTLALTQSGVGVSLITESSINNVKLKELPALYIANEEICTRAMFIARPMNKYLSKAAAEFIRILKAVNKK
ncbi:MAG: LysR family transcriptional regulator [Firmicutes bacterium]|nr:LysR family transcriptional regulator [Bacillota bacterium]